jgi:hypothetical protein
MPEADEREFVIHVERRWKLWILPILAVLYFLFVLMLAVLHREVSGVPMDTLVLAGLVLFAVVILVQIPFMLRRRVRGPEPAAAETIPPAAGWTPEPPPTFGHDDEKLVTSEVQQGLTVLEYSAPAKSRHRGAVYAKAYVPVTKEHVLRVETLAAEGADL